MKICSLSIENFGKLHRYDLTLQGGLNTLCQENGWGKTTLAAFLKAMFYGLPKSGKKDLDENDYKRFTPWQGGPFGGTMEFTCQKGRFRVERTFGDAESFALYDTASGLASSAFSENLGEELFGIDADGFDRSVFLSTRTLRQNQSNDTLHAKLTGIDEVHDMANYEIAISALEERAKEYKKRGEGGKINEIEGKIRATKESLESARQKLADQETLEKELADVRLQLAELDAKEKNAKETAVRAAQAEEIRRLQSGAAALKQKLTVLEKSFDGKLPSKEGLDNAHMQLRHLERERAAAENLGLTREEEEELVALSAKFAAGAPKPADLEAQFAVAADLREKAAWIRRETQTQRQLAENAGQTLAKLPSTEELEKVDRLLSREATPQKQPLAMLLFILSLSFGLLGIVLMISGAWKPMLPLLITGGICMVLCVAGIIAAVCIRLFAPARKSGPAQAEIDRFFARYGIPAGLDPHAVLARFAEQTDQAEAARKSANSRLAALAREEEECAAKATELRAFLAAYEMTDTDPEVGLRRLSDLARDWERLWKKQKNAVQGAEQKKETIAELSKQLNAFFARCLILDDGDDEETKLKKMEDLVSGIHALRDELSRREAELQDACKNAGWTPDDKEELPTLAALNLEEEARKTTRAALAEKESRIAATLNRLISETEMIPEWEENLIRLNDELKDLRNRHRLLLLTRDYLKQAHDDLTTRYLAPARESFNRYLAALSGSQVPKATLAADFSVTVLDAGKSRPMESYSRGWRDLLIFCVRLAMIDALYADGEAPFLLLDDPFANLDEERLDAAKTLLATLAEKYQILHLVCHPGRV